MANYDSLINAVKAAVKTNGTGAITGATLQATLLGTIEELTVGFQFMGVATPETTPDSNDKKEFYLGFAGTYANFGSSVTVPEGSVILFKKNDGAWSSQVVKIADLVSVSQNTETGHTDIIIGSDSFPVPSLDDYYKLATYDFDESQSFTTPINVKSGQKVVVDVTAIGADTQYAVFTLDHSSTVYEHISAIGKKIITATSDGYIRFYKESGTIIKGTIRLYSSQDELQKDIDDTNANLDALTDGASINPVTLSEVSGYFINYGGNVLSVGTGFCYTQKVYFSKGEQLSITARGYSNQVSIFSKVITEGSSYTPIIVSTDSVIHTWNVTIEEDGYYAFSWSMNADRKVIKKLNTPQQLSDRITALEQPSVFSNTFFGIPTIGIIGDSLASGAGYDPYTQTTSDHIEYAWWKVLERRSGREWKRFCQGGMSTRSFITNNTYGLPAALTQGNECDLYIIGLEVNDRSGLGPSYLGSVNDINLSNPDLNGDTYYGNYAKIIQKITAFNSKAIFMLFTNPRTDGEFNNAIRTIAGMFSNCYLVDLWDLYSQHFTEGGYYKQLQDYTAHYPAIAYASMAELLEAAIDNCINNNLTVFKNIQY